MIYHHLIEYAPNDGGLNFWKDILPTLISSAALATSVVTPYFLIKYEKIYNSNNENKDFIRKVEIYLLEWLNVTSYNAGLSKEFLNILETVGAIFPNNFQFYDFPNTDFFKSYNTDLINEFYFLTRNLKDLNHHLKMIDTEYQAFKKAILSGGNPPANSTVFFKERVSNLLTQYPKAIEEITNLRINVRLLLKESNGIDALKINRFFSFKSQGRFWYKTDLNFTKKELEAEKIVLKLEASADNLN